MPLAYPTELCADEFEPRRAMLSERGKITEVGPARLPVEFTAHNKNVSGSVRFAHSPYMALRRLWRASRSQRMLG